MNDIVISPKGENPIKASGKKREIDQAGREIPPCTLWDGRKQRGAPSREALAFLQEKSSKYTREEKKKSFFEKKGRPRIRRRSEKKKGCGILRTSFSTTNLGKRKKVCAQERLEEERESLHTNMGVGKGRSVVIREHKL